MVVPSVFYNDQTWVDKTSTEDLAKIFREKGIDRDADLVNAVYTWKRDGIVVFENAISHALIDSFLEELEVFRDRPNEYVISVEIQGKQTWSPELTSDNLHSPGVKYNHLHASSLHAAKLSLNKEATRFLSVLFEAAPIPMQSLTFWHGSQQPTHIDYPYVRRQKRLPYMAASWIPLEDIHEDAGPLAYFPGGHSLNATGFFDWGEGNILSEGGEAQKRNGMEFAEYLNSQMRDHNIAQKIFLPKKGDLLIWHANMPHQGTKVNNNDITRKSYVTHYTGLDDYPSSWIKTHHETGSPIGLPINDGFLFDYPWANPNGKLPSWDAKLEQELNNVRVVTPSTSLR